ncbi:MAG: oligosaccharide flippase family protein, partial [Lachnospiraceae bacterium]|nr:oligosaccharide flippase family protein [Lachnospiraceae bacterium]
MTMGSPLRLMVSFALPLLMGNLFQQLYNMVDAAIVGRYLGPDALAGVGASSSVQFLVIGFCLGVCSGFGIPVAQRFGARDMGDMRRYVYHALVLTGVLA